MGRASGCSNTPHWIRNNILDFLRAMSVKIAVENGNICNIFTYKLKFYSKVGFRNFDSRGATYCRQKWEWFHHPFTTQ